MGIVLRIIVIAVGVLLIAKVMEALKKKKMSAVQSLLWLFAGLVISVLGIFPTIVHWAANLLQIYWAPAILFFVAFVIIGFICFNHTMEISVLRAQVTELTEQVSVLKFQLQESKIIQKGPYEK